MIKYLQKYFNNNDDDLRQLANKIAKFETAFQAMEDSFTNGGDITWEQFDDYEISTAERPVPYKTGRNCLSFRLTDMDGKRVFYTKCVAPKGQVGIFGWHWHSNMRETNTQLTETAEHDGQKLPPFSVTVFEPNVKHDYMLPPGGSLLTVFEKVG